MFRRGKQYALLHQAGGIANSSDVSPAGLNPKIVQVRTPKNDSGIGRGRYQADVTEDARMKADSLGGNHALGSRLKHEWSKEQNSTFDTIRFRADLASVFNSLRTVQVRWARRGLVNAQRIRS